MSSLAFDAAASEITIETKAVGMLAKLAHDLSIAARGATATFAAADGKLTVTLRAPVRQLEVRGVKKGSSVDTGVLSASDRAEIERRMREEVLPAAEVVATLVCDEGRAALADDGRRTVPVSGTVEVGRGRARVTSEATLVVTAERATAEGRLVLDLPALGITPPKGPLGAFKLRDTVDVVFRLVFGRGA